MVRGQRQNAELRACCTVSAAVSKDKTGPCKGQTCQKRNGRLDSGDSDLGQQLSGARADDRHVAEFF